MANNIARPDSVNRHYLNKVIDLAEERHIEATDDIFNAHGVKLVAKGTRISRQMQDKLIVHKLYKPFESCIGIEGGIDTQSLLLEAKRLSETIESVGYMLGAVKGLGRSPFDIFANVPIGKVVQMMLSVTEKTGPNALMHSVMVSLLSISLGNKLGLGEKEQSTLAVAGLLHDVGELYIDPLFLHPKEHIQPHEWRHVVLHPHIGSMLISELKEYPPEVALAVAEHHERLDGGGYPRQISNKQISVQGQILSVVEMISGLLLSTDSPLECVELALKIIPAEHSPQVVSAISSTVRSLRKPSRTPHKISAAEANNRINVLHNHIAVIIETCEKMPGLATFRSAKAKELCDQALVRINTIKRAFASTGLELADNEEALQNQEILFEAMVVTKEIRWRLREIARSLALRCGELDPVEATAFKPLIAMLDAKPDAKSLPKTRTDEDLPDSKAIENAETSHPAMSNTLLLVDDDPNTIAALLRSLKPLGFSMLTASNALEALTLLEQHDVGVILADHEMPGMTGIELLSRAKVMYPLAVRIVLSAHSDVTTVLDAINIGAVYKYLTKPWNHTDLCDVLKQAFIRHESLSKAALPFGPH